MGTRKMKMSDTEMENYRAYSKMNKSIFSCKVNQLNVHLNADFEHELAKFKIFWKLRKEGSKVITEAWQRGTDFRRDLVDLTNGEIYEIETDMKRAIRFVGEPINIIPVGWTFEDKKWIKLIEKGKFFMSQSTKPISMI